MCLAVSVVDYVGRMGPYSDSSGDLFGHVNVQRQVAIGQSAGGYIYSRYIARCFQKSEIEPVRHQMCLGSLASSPGPTRAPGASHTPQGGAVPPLYAYTFSIPPQLYTIPSYSQASITQLLYALILHYLPLVYELSPTPVMLNLVVYPYF
ncbi:hypothetical protein HAX54_023999 [Datura stramonium]|uniref:Uncharacterized protein n=1 Tax=Datura stramonium TaxID=4076 RepID=A0ABS8UX59_DATST|nr:hypothetical protein [Datura stramonium]